MTRPPRKRYVSLALLLSLVLSPFASMLYLGRGLRAIVYFLLIVMAGVSPILMPAHAMVQYWPVIVAGIWIVGLADSARIARHHRQAFSGAWYSTWYGLAGVIAAVAVLHVAIRTFVITPFRIATVGMEPALIVDDLVLTNRWDTRPPRHGEVLFFRYSPDHVPSARRASARVF